MENFKNVIITKTETFRLTADIFVDGNPMLRLDAERGMLISLDGAPVEAFGEYQDGWYRQLDKCNALIQAQPIGSTADEVVEWWLRSHGFQVAKD